MILRFSKEIILKRFLREMEKLQEEQDRLKKRQAELDRLRREAEERQKRLRDDEELKKRQQMNNYLQQQKPSTQQLNDQLTTRSDQKNNKRAYDPREQHEAAVKIQKTYRGYRDRRKVDKLKEQKKEEQNRR